MGIRVGFLVLLIVCTASMASAQSLSRLVPNLVFADVTLAPGPTTTPPVPGTPHTAHFSPFNPLFGIDAPTEAVLEDQLRLVPVLIRQANSQLATFPIGSSSGGFTYRFNPELGTFSRSSESFGPLLTERALTLGRGQFSFGTVYQHTSFDDYEDLSLKNSEIAFYYPHNDCCPGQTAVGVPGGDDSLLNPAFEGDVLKNAVMIDLRTDTFAFFATAGVTNALDIGVVVPVIRVKLDAAVERSILRLSTESNPLVHSFDNAGATTQTSTASGTSVGVGDVLLRSKYQLFANTGGAVAIGAELRLPTGDETELLGTGSTQGRVALLATTMMGVASLHANVGYTASRSRTSDEALTNFVLAPPDELNYAVATDVVVHPRVTAAFEITGRRLTNVEHVIAQPLNVRFTTLTTPTVVQTTTLPGLGIERSDLNLMLGAAGLKVNLTRTLLLNGAVLFPLTDNGLHNRTTASIGMEYTLGR
jgi:outer membrane putative beta-barrel porin/alpha-amylase